MSVRYYTRQFDLAIARDNLEVDVTGGLLHALTATSRAAVLSVRFDGTATDLVTLKKGDGVEVQFKRIFLTNAAQPGETIDILVVPDPKVFKLFQGAEIGDIDTVGTLGSITAPVDISDRVARVLGVIESITDPVTVAGAVDVSDRAARDLGKVDVAGVSEAYDEIGFDASTVNNPSINTVIATTGDLPAGKYEICWGSSAQNINPDMYLAFRNAADAVQEEFRILVGGNDAPSGSLYIELAINEEVLLYMKAAETGNIGGYISWRRMLP